ncbi:MAG TPA: cytochrome c oxidase subunit 4 [Propionibacterium sp.]|nr:cytochrome c oxidase subunit 4 [Propionibacterium sp.]
MKREAWIYFPLAAFFFMATIIYFFLGRVDLQPNIGGVTQDIKVNQIEWAGVAALLLSGLMMMMIGGVFYLTGRKMDKRPEDRKDGEVVDGAGDIGFFPPSSIWPFWTAMTAGLIFLGPVFGWWLTFLGVGFGIWALGGWLFQYYRGDYQH